MSNQDQVAQVIRTWQQRHKNVMDDNPDWAAQNLAIDLHQAGLLASDLPTLSSDYASIEVPTRRTLIMDDADCPTLYENRDSILVGTVNSEVEFSLGMHDEISVTLPADKARNLAYALLAAAQYAEEA